MRLERPVINGRQSAIWYVVWTDGRRSRRVSTRTRDLSEAERFLARYRAALETPPETWTLGDLLDDYLSEKPDQRHHAVALRKSFGVGGLSGLTGQAVRRHITARRGAGRSDGTIRRELAVLRAALSHGVRAGWLPAGDVPRFELPASPESRERFLTHDEFYDLYAAAEHVHLRTFLALAIWTAQRHGAIVGLRWDDIRGGRIDFGAGTRSKRRSRTIPISAPLALALGTAYAFRDSDYVISWNRKPVKSMKKAFGTAALKAGLGDVRIHDLRRTAASWMVQAGVSLDRVALILADNVVTVQKHYARFQPEHLRNELEILGDFAHNARRAV